MAKIKAIIFLTGKGKKRVEADIFGYFPVTNSRGGHVRPGAWSLINKVLQRDPVLELADGVLVRVCQGGSDHIRTEAACVIDDHEKIFRTLRY